MKNTRVKNLKIIVEPFSILSFIILLFIIDLQFALLVLTIIPICGFFSYKIGQSIKRKATRITIQSAGILHVALEAFNNAYLLVGKDVKPEVLEHLSRTKGATAKYAALELNRETLKVKFLVIYGFLVLILLFSAIYIGWTLASQISSPIEELITVADEVSKGNFSAQVGEGKSQKLDEIGTLTKTFNRMTEQIKINRNGLVEANRELDERRKFTEAVLSGVSAGVIGLNNKGEINVFNKSASELLELNLSKNMD